MYRTIQYRTRNIPMLRYHTGTYYLYRTYNNNTSSFQIYITLRLTVGTYWISEIGEYRTTTKPLSSKYIIYWDVHGRNQESLVGTYWIYEIGSRQNRNSSTVPIGNNLSFWLYIHIYYSCQQTNYKVWKIRDSFLERLCFYDY